MKYQPIMIRQRTITLRITLLLLFGFLIKYQARAEQPDTLRSAPLKVLAVGNSFTTNATRYLPQIVSASPKSGLVLGLATIGGGPLDQHWRAVVAHQADAQDPKGRIYGKKGLQDKLQEQAWDVITIQQNSYKSTDVSSYRPYARKLAEYIRKQAPDAELVIHQTWAYRADDSRFSADYSQSAMYRDLTNAYQTIASEIEVEKIIPVGRAFQMARKDHSWKFAFPDPDFDYSQPIFPSVPRQQHSLNRGWHWNRDKQFRLDGHHANAAGEYLAAAVWFEFFCKIDVRGNGFVPSGLHQNDVAFLQGIAHDAVKVGIGRDRQRSSVVADGDNKNVTFVIGDYTVSEGGKWEPESSPLSGPFGIDFDSKGQMYVVELASGRIHRIDAGGDLKTISAEKAVGYAGDGGQLRSARFNGPHNCVVSANDALLVSDSWNHCVRRIDLDSMKIGTLAGNGKEGFSGDDGDAKQAGFNFVMCIALNPTRDVMHIADLKNRRIRNVDLATGIVTTVCGNGQKGVPVDGAVATDSPLVDPRAVASDSQGNLYVLERNGNALRVVRPDGTIHTVAGTGKKGSRDGDALLAQFGSPKHICCDPAGNVYIADDLNGAIRKYDPVTNRVTTLLGNGFGDPKITLLHPHGVRWYKGKLYVVDTGNSRLLEL